TRGIAFRELPDGGKILGTVGDEEVIVLRRGEAVFACGAYCTHYHGPLIEGIATDDTLRCPLHHACFSIRTGEALHAPALDPIDRGRVGGNGDTIFIREKMEAAEPARGKSAGGPRSVIIVGGGAAGLAAAEMLRREGYAGTLTIVSADDSPPC